jgi:hypothetical protein
MQILKISPAKLVPRASLLREPVFDSPRVGHDLTKLLGPGEWPDTLEVSFSRL